MNYVNGNGCEHSMIVTPGFDVSTVTIGTLIDDVYLCYNEPGAGYGTFDVPIWDSSNDAMILDPESSEYC